MGYKAHFSRISNLNYSYQEKFDYVHEQKWTVVLQQTQQLFNRELLIVEKSNDGKPFELHTSYADKEKIPHFA
ncbi:MAG: hypothetical protein ACLVJH_19250 [Faecalibacterium prausnitzii]